jgi:predicted nucleotidyltransferase
MDSSRELVRSCAAALVARTAARERARAERAAELAGEARVAARAIARAWPTVRRVWLFGSVAAGRAREGSDIDLMVEGLPREARLDAAVLAGEVTSATVDLVRLEEAPPSLVATVHETGVALDEPG